MEIKEWTYDEIPEFTEKIEGVSRISTTGDELGTICFPGVVYEKIDGQEYHLQILKPISRNQNELPVKYPCVVYVQGSAWMQQNVFEKIVHSFSLNRSKLNLMSSVIGNFSRVFSLY